MTTFETPPAAAPFPLQPFDELGFGPASHRSALWWLGLLYRRPGRPWRVRNLSSSRTRARIVAVLLVHAAPYLLLLTLLGCGFLALALALAPPGAGAWPGTFGAALGSLLLAVVGAVLLGVALGTIGLIGSVFTGVLLTWWLTYPCTGICVGLGGVALHLGSLGVPFWVAFGIFLSVSVPLATAAAMAVYRGPARAFAKGVLGSLAKILFLPALLLLFLVTFQSKGIWPPEHTPRLVFCGVGLAGLLFVETRAYYWFVHLPFVFPALKGHWYPYHPVAWDDRCAVPFPKLGALLAAYAKLEPEAGEAEIGRLLERYPAQRAAAVRAQQLLSEPEHPSFGWTRGR